MRNAKLCLKEIPSTVKIEILIMYIKDFLPLQQNCEIIHIFCFLQCSSENGQHIIAGAGELHLEICLNDLQELAGVPLMVGNIVSKHVLTTADDKVFMGYLL